METKIRVYGKAQGWTALGIVAAYLKIYPNTTLADLNKAFPREKFASAKSIDHLFIDMKIFEKEAHENGSERAIADAENLRRIHWYITLEDGTDVMFYKIAWGKTSFPLLVEHAKQYGIEVASFEDIGRGKGRGSYEIEYIGGNDDYAVPEAEKAVAPTFKTVKIGSQVWMAENLALTKDRDGNELVLGKDYFYPGNDEKNVEKYGLLYSRRAALRTIPKGWHLPSDEEWKQLERTVGLTDPDRDYEPLERGKEMVLKLCARSGWRVDTKIIEEHPELNSTGFNAVPAGRAYTFSGVCVDYFGKSTAFWTNTNETDEYMNFIYRQIMWHYDLNCYYIDKKNDAGKDDSSFFISVRLVKDEVGMGTTEARQPAAPKFKTVKIGSQVWTAENMALTKDRDGNELVLGKDYFYPGNDEKNVEKYGLLYSRRAALRTIPKGWHLPSDEEWKQLERTVGLTDPDRDYEPLERGKEMVLKLCARSGWHVDTKIIEEHPELNSTGFNAVPAGWAYTDFGGGNIHLGEFSYYWTNSNETEGYMNFVYRLIGWNNDLYNCIERKSEVGDDDSSFFMSVRLVKDED